MGCAASVKDGPIPARSRSLCSPRLGVPWTAGGWASCGAGAEGGARAGSDRFQSVAGACVPAVRSSRLARGASWHHSDLLPAGGEARPWAAWSSEGSRSGVHVAGRAAVPLPQAPASVLPNQVSVITRQARPGPQPARRALAPAVTPGWHGQSVERRRGRERVPMQAALRPSLKARAKEG